MVARFCQLPFTLETVIVTGVLVSGESWRSPQLQKVEAGGTYIPGLPVTFGAPGAAFGIPGAALGMDGATLGTALGTDGTGAAGAGATGAD